MNSTVVFAQNTVDLILHARPSGTNSDSWTSSEKFQDVWQKKATKTIKEPDVTPAWLLRAFSFKLADLFNTICERSVNERLWNWHDDIIELLLEN